MNPSTGAISKWIFFLLLLKLFCRYPLSCMLIHPVFILYPAVSEPVLYIRTAVSEPVLYIRTSVSEPVLYIRTAVSEPVLYIRTDSVHQIKSENKNFFNFFCRKVSSFSIILQWQC